MPLTAAEKMRRRRQKLKDEGKYEDYKKKHRETVKNSRKRQQEKERMLPKSVQNRIHSKRKVSVKERVAKCRRLKRGREQNNNTPKQTAEEHVQAFQSSSSLGKAAARAGRALPKSPRKKRAVIRKLYVDNIEPIKDKQNRPTMSALSPTIVKTVNEFYLRDDISRQAPGRKDVVSVKSTEGKVKFQIRHLMFPLREAHAMFCNENGSVVGKSKFAELRPKHVMLSNKLPHNVCLCKYHENFISAINAFHKSVPKFPEYTASLLESFLCKNALEKCWMGKCEKCSSLMKSVLQENCEDLVEASWLVWQECDGRLAKVQEEGYILELIEYICSIGPQFLQHCYIKREQAKSYQQEKTTVLSQHDLALIQVDFSENYTCMMQDEIQSAHWNQNQISLFTAVTWHSEDIDSYALVSDNIDHTKNTIIAYMDRLLEEQSLNSVQEVHIWSDGPSSQFKNKYIAESIKILEKRHNKKLIWNYFATSHGKGPVDGIGGSIKRLVWEAVKRRKYLVSSASEFVKAANPLSKIKVIEVTDEEIHERNKSLKLTSVIKNAKTVVGIASMHCINIVDDNIIGYTTTKQFVEGRGSPDKDEEEVQVNEKLKVDDWVEVEYDGDTFAGIITEIGIAGEDYKVNVMVRDGKFWKWPEVKDEIFYAKKRVLRVINPPTVVNARGHFKF